MSFKDRLREEIEYKGFSGKEIAAQIGISYSTFLSYIDARGVLPNVETAVKIADILGVSVEYLVKGNKEKKDSEEIERMEKQLVFSFKKLSLENQKNLVRIAEVLK
ncbi:MAG: helix-turn-helix transcriptional regulator [Treponema sp.]|nr:helix-turn-helix transcriptional regulator [Candidatus Treponema equifaecale]